MGYDQIHSVSFQAGINPSAPPFSDASQASLSDGSWNAVENGDGYVRPYRGLTSQGSGTGSRKMLVIGKTWGGIKDIGTTKGAGSFIEDIGRSRWGIGAGQPHIEGTDVSGFTLSTNLKVQVASGGTYGTPLTAGLGQPSAPEIGIVLAVGTVSNPISAKIERYRLSTGSRSLASPTSAVINPQANRVRLTFPAAETGQTHWRAYFTFQGFGGTGVHYLAKYNASTDIPETTVASGVVDGISRSLEFNFQDGDLVPIEASYDDYTPPAATHLIRLETVMNLVGCYVDSTASPTSTNTGVAIAVSKQNNYESYIPTHLLYLPEQVVDVLSRPIDDYGYIACQNSIHAIQYVGDRGDELPPCTITTILPDIGIEYPQNWCHLRGRLLIYTAKGNLLLMDENGSFSTEFSKPVAKILKGWTTEATAVGYDPANDCIVVGNTRTLLIFSFQTGQWRQVYLPDHGLSIGSNGIWSMATAKRGLYISIDESGSNRAFLHDSGTAAIPMTFVTNYLNAPTGNGGLKDIYEAAISAETGNTTSPYLAFCIAKNRRKNVYRRIGATLASDTIVTSSDEPFTADMVGKRVLLFGDKADGADINSQWFEGTVSQYLSSTSIKLKDLAGNAFSAGVNLSESIMFVGEYTKVVAFGRDQLPNFFPCIVEARSYSLAVWIKGKADIGNVYSCDLFGTAYASSRAL